MILWPMPGLTNRLSLGEQVILDGGNSYSSIVELVAFVWEQPSVESTAPVGIPVLEGDILVPNAQEDQDTIGAQGGCFVGTLGGKDA